MDPVLAVVDDLRWSVEAVLSALVNGKDVQTPGLPVNTSLVEQHRALLGTSFTWASCCSWLHLSSNDNYTDETARMVSNNATKLAVSFSANPSVQVCALLLFTIRQTIVWPSHQVFATALDRKPGHYLISYFKVFLLCAAYCRKYQNPQVRATWLKSTEGHLIDWSSCTIQGLFSVRCTDQRRWAYWRVCYCFCRPCRMGARQACESMCLV